jgi:hypothetical protein
MGHRVVRHLIVLAHALLLVACHDGSAGSGAPGVHAHPADRPVAPIAWTPAVPVGSGTLPVELRFGLTHAPVAGERFPLSVVLTAVGAQPALRVRWRGDEDLQVTGAAEAHVPRLDPGPGETLETTLQAPSPGLHLVTVEVALDLPGDPVTRTFQLPVFVTHP